MTDKEGVIKFALEHEDKPIDTDLSELVAWRKILMQLELLGADEGRYDGLGYGNVSQRLMNQAEDEGFVISGSQTGHIQEASHRQFACVQEADIRENRIVSFGESRPSSESLTHAAVYDAHPEINWVFHVHSPDIWHAASAIGLAATEADIPYGTPSMASAVSDLIDKPQGVFVMWGHEDGVVAYGTEATQTGLLLIAVLARSQVIGRKVRN